MKDKIKAIAAAVLMGCVCLRAGAQTWEVTTPIDHLPGTPLQDTTHLCLRDALANAEAGDVIRIKFDDQFLHDSRFVNRLGAPVQPVYAPFLISYPVTIDGQGTDFQVMPRNHNINAFQFNNPYTGTFVGLENLTVEGGALSAITVLQGDSNILYDCVIENTNNRTNDGGGVNVSPGAVLEMTNCTVRNNTDTGANGGGGIFSKGTLYLTGCTVDSNSATGYGGGVRVYDSSYAKITNCTITSNKSGVGAGVNIGVGGATCIINACTIAYNGSNINGSGGGIYACNSNNLYLYNSIVAGNAAATDSDICLYIASSLKYHWNNAVGPSTTTNYTASFTDWTTTGGASSTFSSVADSTRTGFLYLASALADNGGSDSTLALTNINSVARNIDFYYQADSSITAANGSDSDNFGYSVAISADGSVIAVGAPGKRIGGNSSQGRVYVYYGDNWATDTSLDLAGSGKANDQFGYSVAVSADGSSIIIGVPNTKISTYPSQGQVYKYSAPIWSAPPQQFNYAGMMGTDSNVYLGRSVSVSANGNTVIIGAPNRTISYSKQGAAYIWSGSSPVLTASDSAVNDNFGNSVAISASAGTAVIGAPNKRIGIYPGQGAAYIFSNSGTAWSQFRKITLADGYLNDNFGSSVAISADGSIIVISAPNKTVGSNSYQGAAFIYDGNGNFLDSVVALDGAASDYFGNSVAVDSDGSTIIVAASRKTIRGNTNRGAIYVFARTAPNEWNQIDSMIALDGAANDLFGSSVAVDSDGNTVAVGAYQNNVNNHVKQGSIYAYYTPSDDTSRLPDDDQREYPRNAPSNCMGAFEYQSSGN